MKPVTKIDPHIDIADLFKYFKLKQEDFYSDGDHPVTYKKLREANVKILGTTLYFDESLVKTNFYDGVKSFISWYEKLFELSDKLKLFTEFNPKLVKEGSEQISCFYSIEGFECLQTPGDIEEFYDLGIRSFGMTWEDDNKYACGRGTRNDVGISSQGLEVIKHLCGKKTIIDIAHLSEKSVRDLERNYNGMIVTTHGNARSIHNSKHNLTDDEIQIIVDRGGVVSLFPIVEDTGSEGTFAELYRHVEYIASKWGENYVAFASDIFPLDEYPFLEGYKDVNVLNGIEQELLKHLDRKTVKKLFYDNWERVLKEAL